MRERVNNWIIHSRCFSTENLQFGYKWSDKCCIIPYTNHGNSGKRSPSKYPQTDVDDRNFCGSNFGRNGLLIAVTTQRGYIHLFGLLTQFFLVLKNSLDNKDVGANDNDDVNSILEPTRSQNIALMAPARRKLIKRTSSQHAIQSIQSPAN